MYTLNKTTIIDEEGVKYNTYGITYNNRIIEDISIEKEEVLKLIFLCNKLELSPIHLDDVIEDFLVDLKI